MGLLREVNARSGSVTIGGCHTHKGRAEALLFEGIGVGGGRAYPKESWVIVMAALVLNLSFGMSTSFGLFFYAIVKEFGWPMGVTAATFSIYTTFLGVSNAGWGRLSDRYSVNKVVAAGGAITALGLALTSVSSEVWHLYLTFGVMVGLGLGTFFVPSVSVVSKSFDKSPRLKTAVALVTTGTGFGTIVMPPISALFIETFGLGTAFLLQGVMIACIAAPAAILMKPKTYQEQATTELPQAATEPTREYHASAIFHSRTYWAIFLGYLLAALGQTAVMVHLPSYAIEKGISLTLVSVAIGLTGVGTIFGRLIPAGPFARIDEQKLISYVLLLQAISVGFLIKIDSVPMLCAFSLVWGVLWGARVSAAPLLLSSYFGLLAFGAAYGVLHAGFAVGGLFGPTIVGYVHDTTGRYLFGFLFTSLILFVGSLVMFLVAGTRAKDPQSS